MPCKTIPPYASSSYPHIPRRSVLKAGIMHRGDWGPAHGHVCSREKLRCHHLALLSIPFASAQALSIRREQGKGSVFAQAFCPIFHDLFKVYFIETKWILKMKWEFTAAPHAIERHMVFNKRKGHWQKYGQ